MKILKEVKLSEAIINEKLANPVYNKFRALLLKENEIINRSRYEKLKKHNILSVDIIKTHEAMTGQTNGD